MEVIMASMFFGNTLVNWEKRLEVEGTKRKYNSIVPYFDQESEIQTSGIKNGNFLTRFFKRIHEPKPVTTTHKKNPCQDTQPC